MTEQTDIIEILKRSEAHRSLRAEHDVANCLKEMGWKVTQSPYYLDKKTKKLRELDVIASGLWIKPLKSGDLHAKVNIFIEVKTNTNFHILLSGTTSNSFSFNGNEHWIGYSDEAQKKIEEMLPRFDMENHNVLDFIHHVEKIAFPKHIMRTSKLRLKPPPEENCFSAFRETNGKTEKDLDNSVMWRASLALRSAIQSAQEELNEGLAKDLGADLEVARREKLPYTDAIETIKLHACTINLYLPVVVIQSRIWSSQSSNPKELKWARVVQLETYGNTKDWVDVVNFNHLEEYISTRTEYFDRSFKKLQANRYK